jgi:uncharacterized SAM-binding protein YcdF (DUF218 family)
MNATSAGKSEMGQRQISRCSRPSARHLAILLLISFGVVLCAQLLARAYQPIVNLLVETLERRFKRADITTFKGLNGIIVLIGGDKRLAEAGRLARENPEFRVVISGAKGMPGAVAELGGGIDSTRVLLETRSSNTYENALYSAEMLRPQRGERWLLVTGASHMPRAIGSFRKVGLEVEPWPVYDLTVSDAPPTNVALHEWLGLFAYWAFDRTSALFPG